MINCCAWFRSPASHLPPAAVSSRAGGLDPQIQEIREVIELPLTRPELFEDMGIAAPKGLSPALTDCVPWTPTACCCWPATQSGIRTLALTLTHCSCPFYHRLLLTGALLYGPPGTGKTLLARAVANACKATFISVSGSQLVRKMMGAGPKLVRKIFEIAIDKAPSVVFIDEVDAIGGKR